MASNILALVRVFIWNKVNCMAATQPRADGGLCHIPLSCWPGVHPWKGKRILTQWEKSVYPQLPVLPSRELASLNRNGSLFPVINLSLTEAQMNSLVSWKFLTGKGSREQLQKQKSELKGSGLDNASVKSGPPGPGVPLKVICTHSNDPPTFGKRVIGSDFCHSFLYFPYVMKVEIWLGCILWPQKRGRPRGPLRPGLVLLVPIHFWVGS